MRLKMETILPFISTGALMRSLTISPSAQIYAIFTWRRFPNAAATFSRVESLMSSAWFSIREIAVFLVFRRFASSS